MTMTLDRVLELLDGDREILERLLALDLLDVERVGDRPALNDEGLELACVARTLVRELEVNWPGVEVVLRLRRDLIVTRRQLFELAIRVRDLKRVH